jgi:energy-coupling factor transporter ATP-binding protein EcfA2
MPHTHQFTGVVFHRFKAFEKFSMHIRHFNILVGQNNAGKSTILAAFRILAAAMRTATARRPSVVRGPTGDAFGYAVDLKAISVAEENIFYNYDGSEPAHITFKLSNRNELFLYFPERGVCHLFARPDSGRAIQTSAAFRSQFNCPIGFVPILGPVEHNEALYEKETARRALFSYQAARNFRNIWYHYPERFEEFREALRRTWPGMDIERPFVDRSYDKPLLHMFCPEGRIPREIFWAGFGFQVWCQMLTHLIHAGDKAAFLIDEPDIYLHSDLQRQLLGLLRELGPDILIATHSTEIIAEAESDDIVLINKREIRAKRIRKRSQLADVFSVLGSNLNPILTQLAKTRRAIFVEGTDFVIVSRFAARLSLSQVANRTDFAVVPAGGFSPDGVKNLKKGVELTLGSTIRAAAIFDRDYRSRQEATTIEHDCGRFCDLVVVHGRKEIENFLLVPSAIDRAVGRKLRERTKRTGIITEYTNCAVEILDRFAAETKNYVMAQCLSKRRMFERRHSTGVDEATTSERAFEEFDELWHDRQCRLAMISGKDALRSLNKHLQDAYGISITPLAIIDAMEVEEVPSEMNTLVQNISTFVSLTIGE